MRTTHPTLSRPALIAAAIVCTAISFAQAQQSAITLLKPASSNADAASVADAKARENPVARDYREFTSAKLGERSAVETFAFSFHATTKVTGISISGDFRI